MKIKNAIITLHFKNENVKIDGDIKSQAEIKIVDSQDNIILKMLSINDEIIPDFSKYIEKKIIVSTKNGEIKGIIKGIKKIFEQEVFVLGEINTEFDLFLNWGCHFCYWLINPKDLPKIRIELQSAPIEFSFEDYKSITEKAEELCSEFYEKLYIAFEKNELTTAEEYSIKIPRDELENILKDIFSKALYLKTREPKLYELLISVLENKINISETEQEKNKQ